MKKKYIYIFKNVYYFQNLSDAPPKLLDNGLTCVPWNSCLSPERFVRRTVNKDGAAQHIAQTVIQAKNGGLKLVILQVIIHLIFWTHFLLFIRIYVTWRLCSFMQLHLFLFNFDFGLLNFEDCDELSIRNLHG